MRPPIGKNLPRSLWWVRAVRLRSAWVFIQLLLLSFRLLLPILPIHGTMSAPPPDGTLAVLLDRIGI